MAHLAASADAPVVLFDGVCGLCDAWVQFVLRHDREGRFRFAALQSPTAAELLERRGLPEGYVESIVLVAEGHTYRESRAVVEILRRLGGVWSLSVAALIVPAFARDMAYRFVARHRYSWFGRLESCRLPTPAERSRFL